MHHTRPALVRTISSQWLSVIYSAAVMFFLLVFVARKLGPSSLAIFLYVQAVASLFAIFQDGGYQTLLFRETVSPSKETGMTTGTLVSGYLSYIILITLFGSAVVLLSPVTFKTALLLALIYFAFRCITNMVSSLLKGQGSFIREALWRAQVSTCIVIPVILIIWFTAPSPGKVFLGFIIGQLLLLATKNGREFISRPKLIFPPWQIWKTGFTFMMINAATLVYFKSDIVLLKHLQTDLTLVGYYGAAFQFLEGVIILATPVVHLLFRYMRLGWLDKKTFSVRLGKSVLGVTVVALLLTSAGVIFAPKIMMLVYGKAYRPAADLLPLLLLALIFLLPNFIMTQGLIAQNGEKYYAVAASLCAAFNVGLNFYLIPRFSAKGAAFSTVATEVLLTLLLGSWFVRWYRTGGTAQGSPGKSEEEKKRYNDDHVK